MLPDDDEERIVDKIWASSGDSHLLEPDDLWRQILPESLAERMPRSELVGDDEEIVHVDGESFRRKLPKIMTRKGSTGETIHELITRPQGARDITARVTDLDNEGIWAEVVYPSLGLWQSLIKDRQLLKDASRAQNEWFHSEIQSVAPDRLIPTAQLPLVSVDDAVAELEHVAEIGLHAVNLPVEPPEGADAYNSSGWDPLWAAAEAASIVLAFHIGSSRNEQVVYGGPGGAILNYVETTYSGQRIATSMVASGVLDRRPGLKILISEGGASWVPFLGDRMNEAYRQHGMFVRPKLSRSPKEILYSQVYASFQHDETAVPTLTAMGYENVVWGSDYPHIEGTYGHTQETLRALFDGVDESVRGRIAYGALNELFPHLTEPPGVAA